MTFKVDKCFKKGIKNICQPYFFKFLPFRRHTFLTLHRKREATYIMANL